MNLGSASFNHLFLYILTAAHLVASLFWIAMRAVAVELCCQKQVDGTERVVDYGSRALHLLERNYCATRLEMLVLVEFLDYFSSICLFVSFSSEQTTMP